MKTDGDAGRDSEPGPSPGIEKVIMSQKAAAETVSSAAKISSDQKEILHRAQREAKGTKGQGLMFAALCETFSKIEETTGRLEIMEHLTQLFLRIIESNPTDLVRAVYLCVSRVAPEYEGIELGIGESLLMKAIAAATGRTVPKVKENLAQLGDLGKVAEACRGKQRT
ncbi:ATP-dependent DNA ligase Cdc17, partial [Spiromyces aspiralis]